MKKRFFFFFGVVIFFVLSLFVVFGFVRTRFVSVVTSPVSSLKLGSVQHRNLPAALVDVVNPSVPTVNVGNDYQV